MEAGVCVVIMGVNGLWRTEKENIYSTSFRSVSHACEGYVYYFVFIF